MPELKFGDAGKDVIELQEKLKQLGYFNGLCEGNFLNLTKAAVLRFQTTHLDKDHMSLIANGIVDASTIWALENPNGDEQHRHLDPRIPDGLTAGRLDVLGIGYDEYGKNVREIPDGSNDSPAIRVYGPPYKVPWCMKFGCYVYRKAKIIDFSEAGTATFLAFAKKRGWFYSINDSSPRARMPGNGVIWQFPEGGGHFGIETTLSKDGRSFNVLEGNHGNRLALTVRDDKSPHLVGFINPFEIQDQTTQFSRGLLGVRSGEGFGTR